MIKEGEIFVATDNMPFGDLKRLIDNRWKGKRIVVLCDENTEQHCLPLILSNLESLTDAEIISIPGGEPSKNLQMVERLIEAMLDLHIDRNAGLICLGGGVVTDIGGFLASVYKRGIEFIHIPTTLLGMVDASVGGKTGVNVGLLKNQIGNFSLPKCVWIYRPFLQTLPDRQLRSGFAEMMKHGLIANESHWRKSISIQDYSTIPAALIHESALIKESIVRADFRDSGRRKILNFGHTIGHAIESLSMTFNEALLHGESVAWGMVVEAHLSLAFGLKQEQFIEVQRAIEKTFQKPQIAESHFKTLIGIMSADKKNQGEAIGFVLLQDIGKPSIDQFISLEHIHLSLKKVFEW